ncbi:hypothetical protein DL96DRAFT_1645955 [Flagelloscypha sp. PMI_526]|nr:hypothetical protein DL96DRAFT_1645955 [Flagelloscypha sp. PMI_526]
MVFLLSTSTLYPLFHEIARKPHLRPEELIYYSESLSKRSKMVINGLLALIGLNFSTPSASTLPPEIKISFVVLTWCITNRLYYEELPVNELQERVRKSGPGLVATLYAFPEMYQILFIGYKVIHGGWIGFVIVTCGFIIQLLLRAAFHCRAGRRGQAGILPM